ncbi:hypothetical protein [Chitinophaga sp. HK235]|uniref:hypothetical protein n=1 Tax=Chitinophaga sp. HK235 TaxID=2952571 RepID=UPI001BABD715|nr:hypothetical protein [Chitinophaga sp. HK235]
MEDIKLENLWNDFNRKVEEASILNMQAWMVNLETFTHLQQFKVKTILNSIARFKIWAVLLGIILVLLLGFLVYADHLRNPFFTISMGMIMIFTIIAIIVYLRQVIQIRRIDLGSSVTDTLQRLSALQASTIHIYRVSFLQMPFYCTWFWTPAWIHDKAGAFWLTAFPVTLGFTLLSIWLFRNITPQNMEKKWFRILFGSKEWTYIIKAAHEVEEIERFKNK